MNLIYKSLLIIPLLFLSILFSCNRNSNEKNIPKSIIGKKMDLMGYAMIPYNIDSCELTTLHESKFKILTYGNLYCEPCWNNVLEWNKHVDDFLALDNVVVICYVNSTVADFKQVSNDLRPDIPIFIDERNRLPIVNGLSNLPDRLTFLLDENNEVLLVGPPFLPEMKMKYMEIISKNLNE